VIEIAGQARRRGRPRRRAADHLLHSRAPRLAHAHALAAPAALLVRCACGCRGGHCTGGGDGSARVRLIHGILRLTAILSFS